jgi:nicotinamide mononucleotide (NMN) deamidase PncC
VGVGESRENVADVIILKCVADLSVSESGINGGALECATTPGDPGTVYLANVAEDCDDTSFATVRVFSGINRRKPRVLALLLE